MEINEDLVRSLLLQQAPEYAELVVRPGPTGWDNTLWRLGDEFALRTPNTERAPSLLRKEWRWLPDLASVLPLPVPTPLYLGEPTSLFPLPWSIVRWVPGTPADVVGVSAARASEAAVALGRFLRVLHEPAPAEFPDGADGRGRPLSVYGERFERGFGDVADSPIADELRAIWREALAAPAWSGPRIVLHADLHPANVLTSDGTFCGVIDFGDMCGGDPAYDLAAAWLLLPKGSSAAFFDAYGPVDDATVARARGCAVMKAGFLVSIGLAGERGLPGGKKSWGPAGWSTFERLLGR